MMSGTGAQWIVMLVGVCAALAVLGMLRVLACYREQHVVMHDTIRQVRRMRNEYLQRVHERDQAEDRD